MTDRPPIVDGDLLERTRSHMRAALQIGDTDPVPGDGLVQVFARLAGIVADRINAAADKNFLAFLDLVGVRQTPPRAARAPLSFTLARGTPNDAFVAAGSMAAAPPGAGKTDPVVFETERDLLVTRAQLQAAVVLDPARDRLADLAAGLAAANPSGADPFSGTTPLRHRLLIGSADALALGPSQQLSLSLTSSAGAPDWLGAVEWAWWDGSAWQPLGSGAVSNPGQITFASVAPIPSTTIAGVTSRWLGATLSSALPATDTTRDGARAITVSAQAPPDAVYADEVSLDTGQAFAPFGVTGNAGACMLRADAALGKPDATVEVRIDLDPDHTPLAPSGFGLVWEYWNGNEWTPLSTTATPDRPGLDPSALLGSGTVGFTVPPDSASTTWPPSGGVRGYWLRIERQAPIMYSSVPVVAVLMVGFRWSAPRLSSVSVSSQVGVDPPALAPDAALVNGAPVDATRDFLAFGATPSAGAALYLACDEAIAPTPNRVQVSVTLTSGATAFGSPPTLVWEYWDATAADWQRLSTVTDGTRSLTTNGTVMFTAPTTLGAVSVAGRTHRWLRVRLATGGYGVPATYVSDGKGGFIFNQATLAPPSIASVRFGYSGELADQQPDVLVVEDWLTGLGTRQISAGPPAVGDDGAFDPFTPMSATEPTLLLGFSEPFANAGIDLYFGVAAAPGNGSDETGAIPQVVWEYNDGTSWRTLGAEDETAALSLSGIVSFLGPVDLVTTNMLGSEGAWLRARLVAGGNMPRPALLSVLTGTMWASQQHTVSLESLGSGTGQPSQQFQTMQRPVLEGQRLEVLEPEAPASGELAALSPNAVRPAVDATGRSTGVWVTWTEVTDFIASGPRDRHYVIDRVLGTLTFGDGQRGLVPPAGRGNVAVTYQAGGGQSGNLPAGRITQLRTAIPFISGVTNHEPAEGGADAEDLALVEAGGPRSLRHRERAVAAADYEDLAFEASTAVARSLAVPAASLAAAGTVGLVIVPTRSGPRPTPTAALVSQVRQFVGARMTPAAELWVSGPGWLEVTVTAGLVPLQAELATNVQSAAVGSLAAFLDPLTGGPAGIGWPFGREPYAADLIALLERLDGLDHVAWLTVDKIVVEPPPGPNAFLVSSGEHTITMLTQGSTQ